MPNPRSPPPGLEIQPLRMSPGLYVPSSSARCSRGRSERVEPSTSSTLHPSTPGAPFWRTTFSRAVAKFAGDATTSSNLIASAALAPRSLAVLQFAACRGSLCRRMHPTVVTSRPIAGRQQTPTSIGVIPCLKTHRGLRSTRFHAPHRYYETIRLLLWHRIRVAAFAGSTVSGPQEISWGVRMNDFPPPPPLPSCHDWIPGVALEGTLAQTDLPYGGSLAFGAAVHLGLPSHTPSRGGSYTVHT